MSEKSMGGVAARMGIVGELLSFLWQRKLWWLIPMILVIVLCWTSCRPPRGKRDGDTPMSTLDIPRDIFDTQWRF